jgi:peptidoglycan L-alanyl-D-glutamate endopeptidase CwlK
MNDHSKERLKLINPHLAKAVLQMAEMYETQFPGDVLEVEQGLRSWAEQQRLYAQGRTTPGNVVTQAQAGHSWHEYGLAVDVCPASLLNQPNWAPADAKWKRVMAMGESCGLYPGAKFSHPDQPHFQLTGRFGLSPDDEARQLFRDGGMTAVWQEAGLLDT